jgi:hypothetical protein
MTSSGEHKEPFLFGQELEGASALGRTLASTFIRQIPPPTLPDCTLHQNKSSRNPSKSGPYDKPNQRSFAKFL